MHRDELPIHDPCEADWSAMDGDAQRRRCALCGKHVHDLSAMTEESARSAAQPGRCIRYTTRPDGTVYQPPVYHPPRAMPSRRAAVRSLLAAMVALPIGLLPGRAHAVHNAISGRVVDRYGEPMPSAIVSPTPGNIELVTDSDGRFSIDYLRDNVGERTRLHPKTEYLFEVRRVGHYTAQGSPHLVCGFWMR